MTTPTPVVGWIVDTIEGHLYEICQSSARLCSCGWPETRRGITTDLQTAHRAHLAAVLSAPLADRVDGMPPGIEAALEAAAQGSVDRDAEVSDRSAWTDLRLGDRNAIKSMLLPLVVDACAAQIAELRR